MSEHRYLAYRLLSGSVMLLCLLIGAVLLGGFVANVLLPLSMQPKAQPVATNYWGYYMMGFAGALLFVWGACLLSAVRAPALARGVGTATAFGLVLNALFRMLVWFSGEYAEVGNLPRVEATIMLVLAIGFIWLRPPPARVTAHEARPQ